MRLHRIKDITFTKTTLGRILIIIIVCQIGLVFFSSVIRVYNTDEFEALHTAWMIGQGKTIYADFFQHHHPLFYYLLDPVIAVSGENIRTIFIARLIIFLILLAILAVTYRIAAGSFDRTTGLTSAAILLGIFDFSLAATEIRPDVLQVLFGLVAVSLFVAYLQNPMAGKKTRHRPLIFLGLSGVTLGISFLTLQKAVFLIFLMFVSLLFYYRKGTVNRTDCLIFTAAFTLTVTPYYVYILISGSWSVYFLHNWLFNLHIIYPDYTLFTVFKILVSNVLLCLLLAAAMIRAGYNRLFRKAGSREHGGIFWLFIWYALGLALSLFLTKTVYTHYLISAAPLIAIVAASVFEKFPRNDGIVKIILLLVVVIPGPVILFERSLGQTNISQLEQINYVLAQTDESDSVYDGVPTFNIFRQDITPVWFGLNYVLPTLAHLTGYRFDALKSIAEHRPALIQINGFDPKYPDIRRNYVKSEKYDNIMVRKHPESF